MLYRETLRYSELKGDRRSLEAKKIELELLENNVATCNVQVLINALHM